MMLPLYILPSPSPHRAHNSKRRPCYYMQYYVAPPTDSTVACQANFKKAQTILEKKRGPFSLLSIWSEKPKQRAVTAASKALEDAASKLAGDASASDLQQTLLELASDASVGYSMFSRLRQNVANFMIEQMSEDENLLLRKMEPSLVATLLVWTA